MGHYPMYGAQGYHPPQDLQKQSDLNQTHDERKQSTGPNVDDQELKHEQIPPKEEQVSSKPAKTKKIKTSKVTEYSGSAKKGGQDQHKL
jgi:hypothetical protein